MKLAKLTEKRSPIPGLVIMAVVVGLVWLNVHTGKDDAPAAAPMPTVVAEVAPPPKAAVQSDLSTMYVDYFENEAAAHERYVDAPITVRVQLDRIVGGPGAALVYLHQPGNPDVRAAAWMDESESKRVLTLQRGDVIELRCKGAPPIDGGLVFRHCTVTPAARP